METNGLTNKSLNSISKFVDILLGPEALEDLILLESKSISLLSHGGINTLLVLWSPKNAENVCFVIVEFYSLLMTQYL